MNKNYVAGRRFEQEFVRELKERNDVLFAFRSAGSKGAFDVIAIVKKGKGLGIECYQLKKGKKFRCKVDEVLAADTINDRGGYAMFVFKQTGGPREMIHPSDAILSADSLGDRGFD